MALLDNIRNCTSNKSIMGLGAILILVGIFVAPLLIRASDCPPFFPKNFPYDHASNTYGAMIRESFLVYHQFPLWMPSLPGGGVWLDDPINPIFNPFSVLFLVFDEIAGKHIGWFLFFLLGASSMYCLARWVLNFTIVGSMVAALVFSMSGLFPYLLANGIFFVREVLLLPLLLIFFIRAFQDRKYIFFSGVVLALLLVQTALHCIVVLLFLFLFSLLECGKKESRVLPWNVSPVMIFIQVCIFAALVAAVKLVPVFDLLQVNTRIISEDYTYAIRDANTVQLFLRRLLVPEQNGAGTMYIGSIPLVLACVGVIFRFRQNFRYILLLCFFVMLSFGPNASVDIHRWLWHFPFFKSMAEIAKYYAPVILFLLALLAGSSMSVFGHVRPQWVRRGLLIAIISVIWCNLFLANVGYFTVLSKKIHFPPVAGGSYSVKLLNVHQGDESVGGLLMYSFSKQHVGIVNSEVPVKRESGVVPKYFILPRYAFFAPLTSLVVIPNLAYRGEAFFLNPGNVVRSVIYRPNAIELLISMQSPDRVIINQNYSSFWRPNEGTCGAYQGLLALDLAKVGDQRIVLRYVPVPYLIAMAVSVIAIVAGIGFYFNLFPLLCKDDKGPVRQHA